MQLPQSMQGSEAWHPTLQVVDTSHNFEATADVPREAVNLELFNST